LREQNRANLRMVRQREQQAIRELQRQQQAAPFVDNGIRAFGIPQAVPEPAPFLDLVEAQGRNIHVVQQQRIPYFAGPGHVHREHFRNFHPAEGMAGVAGAVNAEEMRRREERRHRHNMIREQLEETRRRAARLEQDRLRERQVTEQQRERAQRSREEAMRRLRRNREEVLRRQRRNREPGTGPDFRMERRNREEGAEVRVERVPNAFQMATERAGVEQRAEPIRALHEQNRHRVRPAQARAGHERHREGARGGQERERGPPGEQAQGNPQAAGREFNFQEILDLDALNPAYLGEDLGNA